MAPQYATALGKNANCQTLVSLTLARGEVRWQRRAVRRSRTADRCKRGTGTKRLTLASNEAGIARVASASCLPAPKHVSKCGAPKFIRLHAAAHAQERVIDMVKGDCAVVARSDHVLAFGLVEAPGLSAGEIAARITAAFIPDP